VNSTGNINTRKKTASLFQPLNQEKLLVFIAPQGKLINSKVQLLTQNKKNCDVIEFKPKTANSSSYNSSKE
jgi:hypothetical protein